MRDDMAGHVAAYEHTVRSTIALAEAFEAADWERPTECPGWSVRDQISHIVGVERLVLGDPLPEHTLPGDLPHVRNDMGRFNEIAVDIRRSVPGPKVLDELRDTLNRRLAELPDVDPDRPTRLPNGRMDTYTRFMAFRAFDCWTHEQDIRRAVGRPGNLASPGAERAHEILTGSLPYVVGKLAAAAPGQSVTLEITGPLRGTSHVVVGDDGRAVRTDAIAAPTVTLRMDWETYARLACGRVPAASAAVTIGGDPDLARRVLAALSVTP
ncbi:MAG TPA: maleylpyruvate isomerase family mycothiol-dependent enzyme [Streptosporangiaceae bacterium]|nr:maleylpyruvate isomerase family mycothiol-dependent enzyme [Streptosporangiaceae bacterium]